MKAIIRKINQESRKPDLGATTNFVSRGYEKESNLFRYAFKHLSDGQYLVEIYYNFQQRQFKEADKTKRIWVHNGQVVHKAYCFECAEHIYGCEKLGMCIDFAECVSDNLRKPKCGV